MDKENNQFATKLRQCWLKILAKSNVNQLESAWQTIHEKPEYRYLRRPETGMIMVHARTGGTGKRFNLGEITVTRCTVGTEAGLIGCGYIMGGDHRHVELVALFDALLQDARYRSILMKSVISRLESGQKEQNKRVSQKTTATKVDFFTMVRGE
jgi:alpha-D-ribose 1-methylphosphonate 5-triphosphate synthase subunit PhnG